VEGVGCDEDGDGDEREGAVAEIDETLLTEIAVAPASAHDLGDRGDIEGDVGMGDGDIRVSVDGDRDVLVLVREGGGWVAYAGAGGDSVATGEVRDVSVRFGARVVGVGGGRSVSE
jgi:hypothetical protein